MKVKQYSDPKARRKVRVRSKISGTTSRPRLAISRSSQHLLVQLIDDTKHKTVLGLSTADIKKQKDQTKTDLSVQLGKELAEKSKELKVTQAILDRGFNRYHGRIKSFADSARKNGLKI